MGRVHPDASHPSSLLPCHKPLQGRVFLPGPSVSPRFWGDLSGISPLFAGSGTTTRRFVGHTKDVLSVAFSSDNRQIVSGSRDKTIKLWNTLGVCKYTVQVSSPIPEGKAFPSLLSGNQPALEG